MAKSEKQKIAELLGLELPPEDIYESDEEISRQSEAVLAYVKDSSYFTSRTCNTCGRTFPHTFGQVAYCSNACRAQALAKIGIKWEWIANLGKRWDYLYAEPLIVPAEAYEIILGLGFGPPPDPTAEPQIRPDPTPETGIEAESEGRKGDVDGSGLSDVLDFLESLE